MIKSSSAIFIVTAFITTACSTTSTREPAGNQSAKNNSIINLPGYIEAKTKPKAAPQSFDERTPSEILISDYLKNGRVQLGVLDQKIQKYNVFLAQSFRTFCQSERKQLKADVCRSNPEQFKSLNSKESNKILEKWSEEETATALNFAIHKLLQARSLAEKLEFKTSADFNSPKAQEFYDALFKALTIYESLRLEDRATSQMGPVIDTLSTNLMTEIIINETTPVAHNLVASYDALGVHYYTPQELLTLKSNGKDLSELDPPDSGLWRKPYKISTYDTTSYNRSTQSLVGEDMLNPDKPISVTFKKIKGNGSTPKFNVTYSRPAPCKKKNDSKTSCVDEQTYKLKFEVDVPSPAEGGTALSAMITYTKQHFETQTESVVNNLAAALGFTVDPTYYKKSVYLFLDDGFDSSKMATETDIANYRDKFEKAHAELLKNLEENGAAALNLSGGKFTWNYRSALSQVEEIIDGDQKGRRYLHVKKTSLELKPDKNVEIKLGGFNKSSLGRSLKREFRGFQLFYAWINDMDTKDINSDLGLIPTGNGEYELTYSAADMGASLGSRSLKNSPNDFAADLVNWNTSDLSGSNRKLSLTYKPPYRNYLWKYVGFDDARWMVKMMAQLTYSQIRSAFDAAKYPPYIAEFYTQKMLRRRDQLVKALDLKLPMTSAMTDPNTYAVPGYKSCFNNGIYRTSPGVCEENQWAVSSRERPKGSPQKEVNDALYYSGISEAAQVFVIRPLDRLKFNFPGFIEGVSVGVQSYIPARYIVKNPLVDKGITIDKPYWIVDVVRLGTPIGYGKTIESGPLGILTKPIWDVQYNRTLEFISIHPTRDLEEYKNGLFLSFIPGKDMKETLGIIKDKFLSNMKDGDIIVHSAYDTLGTELHPLKAISSVINTFASTKITGSTTLTKRVSLIKDSGNTVMANWADLYKHTAATNAALRMFILRFVSFKAFAEKLSQQDKTFEFNISDNTQRALLLQQIDRAEPLDATIADKKLLQELAKNTKSFNSVKKYARLGIFGLPSKTKFSESEKLVFEDRANTKLPEAFYTYRKGKFSRGLNMYNETLALSNSLVSEAFVTPDGNIFAHTKIKYKKMWATRKDFIKLTKDYLPLLPADFITFDADSVLNSLGTLELNGEIFFSKAAIASIVNSKFSPQNLCSTVINNMDGAHLIPNLCETVYRYDLVDANSYPLKLTNNTRDQVRIREIILGIRTFRDSFTSMQRECAHVVRAKKNNANQDPKCLKSLVKLLENTNLKPEVLKLIQSIAPAQSLYRYAEMKSSTSGFPNLENEVVLHKLDRGDYERSELEQKDSVFDMVSSPFDNIQSTLARFFYSFY